MEFSNFYTMLEAYKGGNVSKSPILFNDNDLKFLHQFPFKFWPYALQWRYGKGLWEASTERHQHELKHGQKNKSGNIHAITNDRDVILDVEGKKYLFPDINTGLPKLVQTLEKPVHYGKIGKLRSKNPLKKMRRYKGGMTDLDLSDPQLYQMQGDQYEDMTPEEKEKLGKTAPHTFAGMKVMQLNAAKKQLLHWLYGSATGILGGKSGEGRKNFDKKTTQSMPIRDFAGNVGPNPDLQIPVINAGPVTYYEITEENGNIKVKNTLHDNRIVPVLNPGKMIPSLNKANPEHPNAKDLVGNLTAKDWLMKNWDQLTDKEKRHMRKSMSQAHYHKYATTTDKTEEVPNASQAKRMVVGGWEQSKDQRERMPLRYWGFNPSQEKEIINQLRGPIDQEVSKVVDGVISGSLTSYGIEVPDIFRKAFERIRPNIVEIGAELILQNLGDPAYGLIEIGKDGKGKLDTDNLQDIIAGKGKTKGKGARTNYIRGNWIGSIMQLELIPGMKTRRGRQRSGMNVAAGEMKGKEGESISTIDMHGASNQVRSGGRIDRAQGERAHFATKGETLYMAQWLNNIRKIEAATETLTDKSSVKALIDKLDPRNTEENKVRSDDQDSLSGLLIKGLTNLYNGKPFEDPMTDRKIEIQDLINNPQIRNGFDQKVHTAVKYAIDMKSMIARSSAKRMLTLWNAIIRKYKFNDLKTQDHPELNQTEEKPQTTDKPYQVITHYPSIRTQPITGQIVSSPTGISAAKALEKLYFNFTQNKPVDWNTLSPEFQNQLNKELQNNPKANAYRERLNVLLKNKP